MKANLIGEKLRRQCPQWLEFGLTPRSLRPRRAPAAALQLALLLGCASDGANDESKHGVEIASTASADVTNASDTNASDTNASDTNASDTSDESQPVVAAAVDASVPAQLSLSGGFRIQLVAPVPATDELAAVPGHVSVVGRVYDAAPPARTGWDLLEEQAGCELLQPRIPFCDPECAASEVCDADDSCRATPSPVDLGTVTLTGLDAEVGESIEMAALPPSNTYQPAASAGISYPPFDAGAAIGLSAAGSAEAGIPAFTIQGRGVSQLSADPEHRPLFAAGQDAEVVWEPPDAGDVSMIELIVDISHHGGQKGELRCSVDDSGQFSIPAELVSGLLDLGVAGFPEVRVIRKTTSKADSKLGEIELLVESSQVVFLEIPGVRSCAEIGSGEECEGDEVCQQDLRCGAVGNE